MNHYTITKVGGKPQWENIPSLDVNNYQWLPELDIQMKAQICYSDEGIHVHLRAWEQNIRAEHNAPVSMVCEDSCMEFFFRPMEDDLRYFNFEINPNGCTYIGFGPDMPNLVRLLPQEEDTFLEKSVGYTEGGWEAFFTVPVSMVQVFFPEFRLTPGKKIYANCYKCGDETVQPHFMAWNYVDVPEPSFHQPAHFGLMELG